MPLLVVVMFIAVLLLAVLAEINFRKNTYSKMTGNGYFQTIYNPGKYGEYLVYKELRAYERDGGKFLFNCYLPKDDGTTSETDVLLIHSTGIFAVESKNYSGWIFGNEKSRMWTQTLPNGRGRSIKEHFYNPIMQNKAHIKWLRKQVGERIPIYSIIAFSDRCKLKDITVESQDVKVIKRQAISGTVKYLGNQSLLALSKMDIERVYEMLYPYTQVTEYQKQQHIENIHTAKNKSEPLKSVQRDSEKTVSKSVEKDQETVKNVRQTGIRNAKQSDGQSREQTEVRGDKQVEALEHEQDKKICPRCGAEIVLRTARKGEHAGEQFYGCSRYPKCRYHEYISPSSPQTSHPS